MTIALLIVVLLTLFGRAVYNYGYSNGYTRGYGRKTYEAEQFRMDEDDRDIL